MDFNSLSYQSLLYGVPGTGKSHAIKELISSLKIKKDNIFRVVFYRDYTYSDFVGYTCPALQLNKETNNVKYSFIPGPFTLALDHALLSEEKVFLIIEEMNRGNCASIYGDLFQLLDRDKNGVSQYPISNAMIRNYLNKNTKISSTLNSMGIGENNIILPANLYIIGTMNTADQNVFSMDSAFKRRFKMVYVPIDFKKTDKLLKIDELSKVNIFNNKNTWSDFAKHVNKFIDKLNSDMVSISEDKKLGPYFVEEVDVSSRQTFCDKVIYYLKNDVFKYTPNVLPLPYNYLYERIVVEEQDIMTLLEYGGNEHEI